MPNKDSHNVLMIAEAGAVLAGSPGKTDKFIEPAVNCSEDIVKYETYVS